MLDLEAGRYAQAFQNLRLAAQFEPQNPLFKEKLAEAERFIAGIERSEKSFQRVLNRRKIRQIVNFYETAVNQPLVPGTILLFTDETLRFRRSDVADNVGFLSEPDGKFLIIDGQHRLAALHFFRQKHPELAEQIEIPCVLFDGKSADFATEMFVIINSTHTRINKSHLVDLYERVSWETPEKKFAAKVVNLLYEESDSPLRYRINRLGGRSRRPAAATVDTVEAQMSPSGHAPDAVRARTLDLLHHNELREHAATGMERAHYLPGREERP